MRYLIATSLLAVYLFLPGLQPPARSEASQVTKAREALTGAKKNEAKAKQLLLDLVGRKEPADPESMLCAYVYLGYIEDRAGNRQEATGWFAKALAVQGGSAGLQEVAQYGLTRPLTWIRHLDEGLPVPTPAKTAAPGPLTLPTGANALIVADRPTGLTPARNLSADARRDSFEALWKAIDAKYADFNLKAIDWPAVGERYRRLLDAVKTDDDFYLLLFRLVNELKDTHSWLDNYKLPALVGVPSVTVLPVAGKPYVVAIEAGSAADAAGVKPGSEVLTVDALPVARKIEALRQLLPACSTERAFQLQATRRLLAGEAGTEAAATFRTPDGAELSVKLRRETGRQVPPPRRALPVELTRQRFVHYAKLPSGLGYILISSFNGHNELADEFDLALAALRETPGLILDIRDNPGGFGQPRIVGRLLDGRSLVGYSYLRTGPQPGDYRIMESYLDSTGDWQYSAPVVLLVNGDTGSAADLFAAELRGAGRVVTVGSQTHGNLSGVATYAVLPCALVVRISNGFIADAKSHPVEGVGTVPDYAVEPSLADVLSGRDPVLAKAISLLKQ